MIIKAWLINPESTQHMKYTMTASPQPSSSFASRILISSSWRKWIETILRHSWWPYALFRRLKMGRKWVYRKKILSLTKETCRNKNSSSILGGYEKTYTILIKNKNSKGIPCLPSTWLAKWKATLRIHHSKAC